MWSETSGRASRIIRALKKVDAASRPGAEHQLAILFSDIVGSTGYFERHGDAAGLQMVRRHHELFKPIVQAHEGRVVKTIGDGLMAVFDSSRGAAEAATEMQRCLRTANSHLSRRERIRVRIGIHYGPVLMDATGDVFGDVVNVAARIQSKAGPEQILLGEPVQKELAGAYPLRSVGMFQLKGKTSRLEVFELPWKPPGADHTLFRRARFPVALLVMGCVIALVAHYSRRHRTLPAYLAHPAASPLVIAAPSPHPRPPHEAPPVAHERTQHEAPAVHERPRERPEPPAQGRLTLVTFPKAEVWLGHKRLGRTPVVNLELPAGRHRLRLVGPDHKTRLLAVTVKRSALVKLKLKLRNLPLARAR